MWILIVVAVVIWAIWKTITNSDPGYDSGRDTSDPHGFREHRDWMERRRAEQKRDPFDR